MATDFTLLLPLQVCPVAPGDAQKYIDQITGYVLWGVIPGEQGVSWQGHLGGAAGGLLSAWLINDKRSRRRF